jgi:hypothetical protein
MRKLKCFEMGAVSVQDVIDEFNDRRTEFGIADADIISVVTRPASTDQPKVMTRGGARSPSVVVSIFYWSDED